MDDVVRGFLAGAQAPDIEGMTFDIGSGLKSSVRRVVELVVQQMGSHVRPAFGEFPDRPMEPVQVADVAPALQRLGWECTTTLEKGLRQTIDWYTTNRHVLGMP